MTKKKIDIKNRVLVFGSSGDIGIEICKFFLKKNFYVYFVCRNKKSYLETKNKISTYSRSFKTQQYEGLICDVFNEISLGNIIKKIIKTGSLEVIVNSIGVFGYDEIKKFNKSKLFEFIKINTLPTILINKLILKFHKKKKKIKIISIGSSSAYEGFEKTISYSASKHALLSSIKSINKETYNKGIFNTLVNPGSVKSRMGKKIKNQKYSSFINPTDLAEFVYNVSKVNSPGIIEDIFYKRIIK